MVVVIWACAWVIASRLELFERLYDLSRRWERYELDEVFTGLALLPVAAVWYALGRVREAKRETRRRRESESRLRALNAELQKRMGEIRQLRGIIPICSRCKKIRDGEGYWRAVEEYVREHSEAQFSHGLCDGCLAEVRREIEENP